jgi:hypothetical protein
LRNRRNGQATGHGRLGRLIGASALLPPWRDAARTYDQPSYRGLRGRSSQTGAAHSSQHRGARAPERGHAARHRQGRATTRRCSVHVRTVMARAERFDVFCAVPRRTGW